MLAFSSNVSVRWGKKLQNRYSFSTPEKPPHTADLQSLYDSTFKLNTYLQESQQNPLFTVPFPS